MDFSPLEFANPAAAIPQAQPQQVNLMLADIGSDPMGSVNTVLNPPVVPVTESAPPKADPMDFLSKQSDQQLAIAAEGLQDPATAQELIEKTQAAEEDSSFFGQFSDDELVMLAMMAAGPVIGGLIAGEDGALIGAAGAAKGVGTLGKLRLDEEKEKRKSLERLQLKLMDVRNRRHSTSDPELRHKLKIEELKLEQELKKEEIKLRHEGALEEIAFRGLQAFDEIEKKGELAKERQRIAEEARDRRIGQRGEQKLKEIEVRGNLRLGEIGLREEGKDRRLDIRGKQRLEQIGISEKGKGERLKERHLQRLVEIAKKGDQAALLNIIREDARKLEREHDRAFKTKTDDRRFTSGLARDWDKDVTRKEFDEVSIAARNLLEVLNRPQKGLTDTVAIIQLMKMLDPGSVVRESEQFIIENNQGLFKNWELAKEKLSKGGRLTEDTRNEIKTITTNIMRVYRDNLQFRVDSFRGRAENIGVNPDHVVPSGYALDRYDAWLNSIASPEGSRESKIRDLQDRVKRSRSKKLRKPLKLDKDGKYR